VIITTFAVNQQGMDVVHKAFSELTNNLIVEFVRYFGVVGTVFVLIWIVFRQRLLHRLIQQKFPPASRMRQEFLYSLSSMLIFSLIGVGIFLVGGTKLYFDVDARGWPYFFLSIILAILMHDTYFYWTHRLMHHPKL